MSNQGNQQQDMMDAGKRQQPFGIGTPPMGGMGVGGLLSGLGINPQMLQQMLQRIGQSGGPVGGGSAMSGLALPPGSPITPPGIAGGPIPPGLGGQMPPGFGGPLPNQGQPAPNRGIRPDMGPAPVNFGGGPTPAPGMPMLPPQGQPAPNFQPGFNTLPAFAQGSVRGPQTGMQIMGSPQNQGGGLMNMMGL